VVFFPPISGFSASGHPSTPELYVAAKPEDADPGSISGASPLSAAADRLPHCDTETWYLMVGRDAAESMLSGKPQGTFLIRPSSDGQHALSIMCSGRVGHCKIYQVRKV
jgi:hypothetical protein